MIKKPEFIIIGAGKSGTTSLTSYLKQHPGIYFPAQRESHFFEYDDLYSKGFDWYLSKYFRNVREDQKPGDVTASYLQYHKKVIPRIEKHYPNKEVLFIVILRDPVERAWSHYLHQYRNFYETESFEKALELEEQRLKTDEFSWYGYYRDGQYAEQLQQWFESFGRERFLIHLTDDLKNNIERILGDTFSFLSVSPFPEIDFSYKKNVSSEPRSRWLMKYMSNSKVMRGIFKKIVPLEYQNTISATLREMNLKKPDHQITPDPAIMMALRKRYQYDIELLEDMLGRDLSAWKHS